MNRERGRGPLPTCTPPPAGPLRKPESGTASAPASSSPGSGPLSQAWLGEAATELAGSAQPPGGRGPAGEARATALCAENREPSARPGPRSAPRRAGCVRGGGPRPAPSSVPSGVHRAELQSFGDSLQTLPCFPDAEGRRAGGGDGRKTWSWGFALFADPGRWSGLTPSLSQDPKGWVSGGISIRGSRTAHLLPARKWLGQRGPACRTL